MNTQGRWVSDVEAFAEWLRRQGYRVVRTASSWWYEHGPRVYQAFPFHWVIRPSERELADLLIGQRAIGLRYSAPVDTPVGKVSYHSVYEGADYALDLLGPHARRNVQHGLKCCVVEPIPFERLADEGWELLADTAERQGRRAGVSREAWRARCLATQGLPGFEAWGALVGGKLAAALLAFQMGDCYELLYQQSLRQYLRDHVNNALCFVVTQAAIRRPGVRSVLYGLGSLDAPASVDEFKFRMGYVAKPVRQRVVFHPWLSPLFNRASHAAVRALLARRPGHPTLAKAEGMIRFYLEGRRPVQEQELPEPLQGPGAEAGNRLLMRAAR